jgi:transposase
MVTWFVGIDWGHEEHQVSIVDGDGKEVKRKRIRNDGEGIEEFVQELLARCGDQVGELAVGIETTATAVIDSLLDRGFAVFAINPKQLTRFRDRHSVAGAKDDRRDAYVLADSLRTDAKLYTRLELGDPLLIELREVSRARQEIAEDIVALANQLTSHVRRYCPQWLELGSFHEDRWLVDLFEQAPTPAALKHLKRAKVEAFLKRTHLRRMDAEAVLATLRKRPLPVAPGVADAASERALFVLPRLKIALELRTKANKRIEQLLEKLEHGPEGANRTEAENTERAKPKEHRDAAILLSLPGAGSIVGATMLAEAAVALARRDYQALRTVTGVAPVTSQTGKQRQGGPCKPSVSMRRACNKRLREAMHHWAATAIQHDPRLRVLYTKLRARGHGHSRSLRGVADRLLAMLVAMLRTGTLYDDTRRGSADAPRMPMRERRRAAKQLAQRRAAKQSSKTAA